MLTFPNLRYTSGNHTIPVACSLPAFTAPFAGVEARYVLTQEFIQNLNDFTPLALDTPHPDFNEYLLVAEAEHQPLTGGRVRWTRTYAMIPAGYTEPVGSTPYQFPGYGGNDPSALIEPYYRAPQSKNVPTIMFRDFFLTDSFLDIPIIPAQTYFWAGSDIAPDPLLLWDSPPFNRATSPTRSEWEDMIDDKELIVVEPSNVTRWMGNIYCRETRKVRAQ